MPSIDFNITPISGIDTLKRKLGWNADGTLSAVGVQTSIVCAERIEAFSPVTSNGRWADSANPSASFGRVIGLSKVGGLPGESITVVTGGELSNPSWHWNKGDTLFLSGKGLATVAPSVGFVQRLATASGSTKLVVDLSEPVLL